MPTSRNANTAHILPPDPVYLSVAHSDGNVNTWPRNTERVVENGEVNYMQHIPIDEGMAVKWRVQVGAALANALNKPKGPNYVLEDWPTNYRMYIHNKGAVGSPRQDVYLFGSTHSPKFRSVPEFIPHTIWLSGDLATPCECKYCSKRKSQREITANMGERGIIEVSPGPSPSSSARPSLLKFRKPRPEASSLRSQVAYAAIQKNKLRGPSSSIVAGVYAPHDQVHDLQATHAPTALDLRRWYRNDEVVWVELDSAITGSRGNGDTIRAWPAIVEESYTRSQAEPKQSSQSEMNDTPSSNTSSHHPIESSFPGYDPDSPPWTIKQYSKYKLKLFATSCSHIVRDDQVLPYQAYMPPTELIEALQDVPLSSIRIDNEYTASFSPLPTRKPGEPFIPAPTFEESTGPYALAIQIGSQLAGFWSLTDLWDLKYSFKHVTPKLSAPTASTSSSGVGLDAVISAAAASNSISANLGPSTSYGTANISGNRHMSPEELERTKAATLGAPKPVYQNFSQKNFQGLWWGAERIWTGDLLRLKLGRNAIAPDGAPHIATPSTPGPASLKHNTGDVDPKQLGANSRGVFMRLDALFTVDVDLGNGRKQSECRAAGPLYELADEDWEDPSQPAQVAETSSSKTPEKALNGAPSGEYVNGMSNALPQPSPLKPAALPNPDPSINHDIHHPNVNVNASTSLNGSAAASSGDTGYKAPVPSTHHDLPEPPTGFKFRAILESGYEAVFSLTLLSGRYYPGILNHPLLSESVSAAFTPEGDINPLSSHLWALEGLEPGIANSMDPIKYKKKRMSMFIDAENSAREQLRDHLDITSKPSEDGHGEGFEGDISMEDGINPENMEIDQLNIVQDTRMQVDS
ncbi:hypothetical protein D9757_005705 [Collybiopsis confluens]|uniref:Cryptic loci regulator 2 N-terminal domain-containing protein n=1 Tax=Collybiopsis confluens TaxID=2823264 RepID=A0A8H5HQ27_9AGAR|nr:hypothetical protein D9757_005705 [Collybiopsis confluens]